MPFVADTFTHLFDWEKDPQRQEKIVNARLEAEFDGLDTGLSAVAARVTVTESDIASFVAPEIVVKSGNEAVNNSTALQDDNHLLFPVAANETVIFQLNVKFVEDGATDADIKIAFTGPAGVADGQLVPINGIKVNEADSIVLQGAINIGGASAIAFGASTASRYAHCMGFIQNGATAGNCTIQWAQNTAQTHDTIVQAGSSIMIWRT